MQKSASSSNATLSINVIRLLLDVMRNDVIHGDRCCRMIGDQLVGNYEEQFRKWIITCHRRTSINNIFNAIENEVAKAVNSYCIRYFLLSAPQLLLTSEGGIALSLRLLAQRIREEGHSEFIHAADEIEVEVEALTRSLDTHRYAHLIDLLGEIVTLYMLRAHVFISQVDSFCDNHHHHHNNNNNKDSNNHSAERCTEYKVTNHRNENEQLEQEEEEEEQQQQQQQREIKESDAEIEQSSSIFSTSPLKETIQASIYQFASEAVEKRNLAERARQKALNTLADNVLANVRTPEIKTLQREQTSHNNNNSKNNTNKKTKHARECNKVSNMSSNLNEKHENNLLHTNQQHIKRTRILHQLPRSSTDVNKMAEAIQHNNNGILDNNSNSNNNNNNINNSLDKANQSCTNTGVEMSSFASSLPTIDESDGNMNSMVQVDVNTVIGSNKAATTSQHTKHLYVPANDSHENLSFGNTSDIHKNSNCNESSEEEVVNNNNNNNTHTCGVRKFQLDKSGARYLLIDNTSSSITSTVITRSNN